VNRLIVTALGGLAGLALLACGSSGATTKVVAGGSAAEADRADGKTARDPSRPGADDFTVREIEEVRAPVYLDEIDREAQDHFREGVRIVDSARPDYRLAAQKFQAAAEKDSTFLEAFFNWGMVLERTGDPDGALAVYQRALQANPGDPSAQAYISKIYLAKAREESHQGNTAEEERWMAESKRLLDALIASHPTNVAVNNAMALYFLSRDDVDTAERYVKEVLYVQPTNVTGLNTRGLINLKRGHYLLARWIFENKVLAEDPTSTEALTNLGYTYIRLEQRALAMRYFQRALEADPENMAVRMNIAAMLLEHLDYQSAFDHYEQVIAAQPANHEARAGRCDAMYGLGGAASDKPAAFQRAIDCYVAYLEIRPERAELYRRIAETYQGKLQNLEKAVEFYEIYGQRARLSAEEAAQNQNVIKTLRGIIASGGLKGMGGGEAFDDFGDEPMGDESQPIMEE